MIYLLIALLGLSIGSFLNVAIHRLPQGDSVISPASHCPICKNRLKIWHNIPLVSFVLLRGRCAFCSAPISLSYPAVELVSMAIFLMIFAKEGIAFSSFFAALFFSLMLALSIIDSKCKQIDDILIIPAIFSAILANTLKLFPHPFSSIEHALTFAGGAVMLRYLVSAIIKKEAMGEGDIYVMAAIGGLLGVKNGVFAIYISALMAILFFVFMRKNKDFELPFVPFLAAGAFTVYYFNLSLGDFFTLFIG